MCAGSSSRAKAKVGSWITLAEWKWNDEKNRYVPVCVKTEYVDGENIKADTCTTIDPPGTIKHCIENNVEILRPKKKLFRTYKG